MTDSFKEGELYRHEKALDTDIMVLAIHTETETEIRMAVWFVNQRTRKAIAPDDVTIKKEDYKNWTRVEA